MGAKLLPSIMCQKDRRFSGDAPSFRGEREHSHGRSDAHKLGKVVLLPAGLDFGGQVLRLRRLRRWLGISHPAPSEL